MKTYTLVSTLALVTCCSNTFAASFNILTPTSPTYTTISITGVSGDGKYVTGDMGNNSVIRGTRWDANDNKTDLGVLSGRPNSEGEYLNANGSIAAVNSLDSSFLPVLYRWTAPSTTVTLPIQGTGTYLYATGISSDGTVLGGWGTINATGVQRMARWTSATGLITVPLPAAVPSTVSSPPDLQASKSLSGNGQFVIGTTINGSPQSAYRYDATTGISTDIGQMQSGKSPRLTSISNDGQTLLGYTPNFSNGDGSNGQRGFLWTQNGGFQDLGFLGANTDTLLPRFLSGDGKTVLGTDSGTNFIWTQASGMVTFDAYIASLGVDLQGMTGLSFRGISDDGSTIVGVGTSAAGPLRGWMLTIPVPEPATLGTLAFAALALLRRKERAA